MPPTSDSQTTHATRVPFFRAGVFRNPTFRNVWAAQGISVLGSEFTGFALPVVAVLLLRADAWELGVLGAADTIAFLLVGLPAGAWVDRWRKRNTMLTADLVRAIAIAAIPVLWWTGVLEIWHLVAVATVVGFATVFFDVAYQSYLPGVLPHEQLQDGNAKLEATSQISRIGGPALAGALIHVVSAPVLMAVDALSYLVSAGFLSRVRDGQVRRDPASHRPLRVEIAEGVRFVAHQPVVRRIVGTTAGSNLFGSMAFTLLPLLVLDQLKLGTIGLGLILSAGSAGGLIGAIATPVLARRLGEGRAIALSAVAGGVCLAALPAAGLLPAIALPLLIVGEFCQLFAVLVYNITQLTLRQRLCPPELLGRMNASIRFVVWGIMPFGSLTAGALGAGFGVVPTMWVAVAGTLASCAFVVFSPLARSKEPPPAVS